MPARFDEDQIALFGCPFESFADAFVVLQEGNQSSGVWHLEWIMPYKPEAGFLQDLLDQGFDYAGVEPVGVEWNISEIEERNWLEESYRAFPPLTIKPFFIYGSHYDGEKPDDFIPLQIDAATAFGSGEHGTTAGCLQFMAELKDQGVCPWNVLDMGTGSGILAIAAWKLWQTPILAVDNSEEAVRMTQKHRDLNGVSDSVSALTAVCGDGFETELVGKRKPYELIVANILAAPLIEMAEDLVSVCDDNGYVILSGMLTEQAEGVAESYTDLGLVLKGRKDIGEWSSLLLFKP